MGNFKVGTSQVTSTGGGAIVSFSSGKQNELSIFDAARKYGKDEKEISPFDTDNSEGLNKKEQKLLETALQGEQGGKKDKKGGMNPMAMLQNIPIIGQFLGGGEGGGGLGNMLG